MNETQLRQIIQEIIEEELEEVSTSGGAGPFNTPFAFAGNREEDKKKRRQNATQAGYTMVEARSKYMDFKHDPSGNDTQKVGRSIAGIAKSLLEIDKILDLNIRLKNDSQLDHSKFWKRTQNNLNKIEKQMVKLMNKIQELKK